MTVEANVTDPIDARRRVALAGSPNFRDFGGYPTRDGRLVRWQHLYRSGSLSHLSEADLETLAGLGIATVCDFRHDAERAREPSRWPAPPEPRRVLLPLEEGDHATTLKRLLNESDGVRADQVVPLMAAINRDFVVRHSDVYAQLLQHVLATPGPVLIHCTAGKDRTGFGAAVILAALGVDAAHIMRDYLLTGHFLSTEREVDRLLVRYGLRVPRDVGVAVFGVLPAYLQAALDAIETEYGGMSAYLRDALGLDDAARNELRGRLLV